MPHPPLADFHPATATWLRNTFGAPTPAQAAAWPAIHQDKPVLVAAPTGSGKTLAAFLAALDGLVRESLASADGLPDETRVVYVSPLKALSNDIHRNLELPLAGIEAELAAMGLPAAGVTRAVRTGDTPGSQRQKMARTPPHVLVTTPESLYILLGSEGGRGMLATARSVIVDEIHAVAGNKRGSHLSLTLERLEELVGRSGHSLQRIGLSATQKPIGEVARFLTGGEPATVVDVGHRRALDLRVEVTDSPLEAVMPNEVWEEVYDRLAELIGEHKTTLVFVNTRRLAERVTRHLTERLGDGLVAAHHGSLSKEQRLDAETRLKRGELAALVATASLELGIDVGAVELVCQLGSTRSIAALLQRVGRSGHHLGGVSKGRVFPLTRDELVESAALLDAVARAELDRLQVPPAPLDILAQHLVAAVAEREWGEDELFALVRGAWPYRQLTRESFDAVVEMLAQGFSTRRGRRAAYLHHDAVNRRLRGRRAARLTALTSGGAIPDTADYQVRLEPAGTVIGSVNEDFAVESLPGDVFQLGNASWRILKIERGQVRVEDAAGEPPNIPFWFGEAPGRSRELSDAVSRLRAEVEARLEEAEAGAAGRAAATAWLVDEVGLPPEAATQLVDYLAAARAALTALPTVDTLVVERFFDEAGDMHLVLHSPHGSRINRAWGLALRKRFCRTFNFELQAAATEDAIVLSLGPTHSFPLDSVFSFLTAGTVRDVLVQALLDSPLFGVRWRWNASRSLALPRMRGGRRVPPQLQRHEAEDLLAVVFPDQLACLENIEGEREVPDHPLVEETLRDCLTEAMDVDGLEALLSRVGAGEVRLVARELTEPSPLALEILNANPYAFLDDAPLEERRTQAVVARRWLDPETAGDLGRLDEAAILRVREEARVEPRDREELHDGLVTGGYLTGGDGREAWGRWFAELVGAGRAGVWRAAALGGGGIGGGGAAGYVGAPPSSENPSIRGERPHTPGHHGAKSVNAEGRPAWGEHPPASTGIGGSDQAGEDEMGIAASGGLGGNNRRRREATATASVAEGWVEGTREPAASGERRARDGQRAEKESNPSLAEGLTLSLEGNPGAEAPRRGMRSGTAAADETGDTTTREPGKEPTLPLAEKLTFSLQGNPDVEAPRGGMGRDTAAAEKSQETAAPIRGNESTLPLADLLWVAVERAQEVEAAIGGEWETEVRVPDRLRRDWSEEDAGRELIRARLGVLGPVTVQDLVAESGMSASLVERSLAALEVEGFVMQGRFTPGRGEVEWCERRLLARIHRYTLDRLRREIRPVSRVDLARFLLVWQRVEPEERGEGPEAVAGVLEQLAGFSAPAAAWEAEILPARVRGYEPGWLDALCLSGRFVWLRAAPPPEGRTAPLRTTPITFLPRADLHLWRRPTLADGDGPAGGDPAGKNRAGSVPGGNDKRGHEKAGNDEAGNDKAGLDKAGDNLPATLSSEARQVAEALAGRGAMFFSDLARAAGLLQTQAERALAELVASGLVSSDSFTGLRALLLPADRRPSPDRSRRGAGVATPFGLQGAGRWWLLSDLTPPEPVDAAPSLATPLGWTTPPGAVEEIARVLLHRYGVLFRALLAREDLAPPWRELLWTLRRLEARGEVRGGRFVEGFAGEQFALPEAVARLRSLRRHHRAPEDPTHATITSTAEPSEAATTTPTLLSVSGADPLNLLGILTPGRLLPALTGNRLLYRNGHPWAVRESQETRLLHPGEEEDPATLWKAEQALIRTPIPPILRPYLSH